MDREQGISLAGIRVHGGVDQPNELTRETPAPERRQHDDRSNEGIGPAGLISAEADDFAARPEAEEHTSRQGKILGGQSGRCHGLGEFGGVARNRFIDQGAGNGVHWVEPPGLDTAASRSGSQIAPAPRLAALAAGRLE